MTISGTAPENTLAALRKAAEAGVEWVELDVKLTADAVPVLLHDHTLERTTDAAGSIAETNFAATRQFDAGTWFAAEFAGEALPSLEEAVLLATERGLQLNVEIKPSPERELETAEAVMASLARWWPADRPAPMISSFKRECLAVAQRAQPDWPRGLIVFGWPDGWRTALETLACVSLHAFHKDLSADSVAKIKTAGYELAAYTVNDPVEARELAGWGVDCMISDDPALIAAALAP